jgi:hypothetical protein
MRIYGGFAGTETTLDERQLSAATKTVLSGDIGTENNAADNCYHVVIGAVISSVHTTILDGFTVTGGNADGGGTSVTVNGKNVIRNNGGGIYTNLSFV